MAQHEPRWIVSGGIGSGKSAFRRILDEFGFFTVDADSVGHEVLARTGPAYRQVAARWPEVVGVDGHIDRRDLGEIVFSNREMLRELEEITHPYIFGTIEQRIQGIPDPVAIEVPLRDIRLRGNWKRVIVDCEDRVRVDRLVSRGLSESDARSRMAMQFDRAGWLSIADLVVPNHGSEDDLRSAVGRLLSEL